MDMRVELGAIVLESGIFDKSYTLTPFKTIISCSWKVIECYANIAEDKEREYQRMKERKQYEPVIVKFREQTINEIYVSDIINN